MNLVSTGDIPIKEWSENLRYTGLMYFMPSRLKTNFYKATET
jgi:hypothetical protein